MAVWTAGEMTPRSVRGVKAPPGRPEMELLAGVVAGFFVVRSGLSTQVASAITGPMRARTSAHFPARAGTAADSRRSESDTARGMCSPGSRAGRDNYKIEQTERKPRLGS